MFSDYFKVKKNGLTPFETMTAYLGGSAFQTVIDNKQLMTTCSTICQNMKINS